MTEVLARFGLPRAKFLRFCVAGTVGFVVDGGLVQLLSALSHVDLVTLRIISFAAAVATTWQINRKLTFPGAGSNSLWQQWLQYVSANGIGASVNFLVYAILILNSAFLSRWPIIAVVAGSAAGLAINYSLSTRFVFLSTDDLTPERRSQRQRSILVLGGLIVTVVVSGITARSWNPVADETQYLSYAYNLYHHGVYSEARPSQPLTLSFGREPGYPALIVAVMAIDPVLRTFSPDCFAGGKRHCAPAIYRGLQWANAVLMGLAALFAGLTAIRLTESFGAGVVAGGAIALNAQALSWRFTMMSDYLALALVALLAWRVVEAARRPSMGRWLGAGLVFALLILTKAVFLYLALAVAVIAPIVLWACRKRFPLQNMRRVCLAFFLAAFVPVLGWMSFNKAETGNFGITDGGRMGMALSLREVYDQMTFKEWATSFLWWTRSFGDNLARAYLPSTYTHRFNMNVSDGFYQTGQDRFSRMSTSLMREKGISREQADADVTKTMILRILKHPLEYLATTLPLFYRGIWIDEFIVLSLPALFVVLVAAWRRRKILWMIALAPGVFSLLIYPATSLNIPRYQLTSVPALALALGIAFAMIRAHRHGHQGKEGIAADGNMRQPQA